jgi:hypothetical protein
VPAANVSSRAADPPIHVIVSVPIAPVIDIKAAATLTTLLSDSHSELASSEVRAAESVATVESAPEPPESSLLTTEITLDQGRVELEGNARADYDSMTSFALEPHASAVPCATESRHHPATSSASSSHIQSTDLTSHAPLASIAPVPLDTPSVPHSVHMAPEFEPKQSVSPQIHKPGVHGSAIRSFLMNMKEKCASDIIPDDSSPADIVRMQRSSAVQLIRQRSALNPESRRKSVAEVRNATHAGGDGSRRKGAVEHTGDHSESSEEDPSAGHIFKNQKIVSVACIMLCAAVELTLS